MCCTASTWSSITRFERPRLLKDQREVIELAGQSMCLFQVNPGILKPAEANAKQPELQPGLCSAGWWAHQALSSVPRSTTDSLHWYSRVYPKNPAMRRLIAVLFADQCPAIRATSSVRRENYRFPISSFSIQIRSLEPCNSSNALLCQLNKDSPDACCGCARLLLFQIVFRAHIAGWFPGSDNATRRSLPPSPRATC